MPNHIERREYNLKVWRNQGLGGVTVDNAFREGWDCFQHDFGHQLKAKDKRIEELEEALRDTRILLCVQFKKIDEALKAK